MRKEIIILLVVLVAFSTVSASEENNTYILKIRDMDEGFSATSSRSEGVEIQEEDILREFSSGAIEVVLSEREVEELRKSGNLEYIEEEMYFETFMNEVDDIINSTDAWDLRLEGLNLTGLHQTACVIDTGINFSHPDLVGKNVTQCLIDCVDNSCEQNCSEADLNGHGTHVAGILAANGSIKGVAPDANLIGLKVFEGSSRSGDILGNLVNAIDWCNDNFETYNITVISMSLGSSSYSGYCDSSSASLSTAINNSYAKNISVVVSSGNDAEIDKVSLPACMVNAIPVGDTYDDNVGGLAWDSCTDTSTALDQIVCHANRNSIVKLFAPGAMINSTKNDGTYDELGGTSMAAPVVSGAILILNQLLDLTSRTKTVHEIEDVLNDTGKIIYDSGAGGNSGSGENFSRIDIYEAALSLDDIDPNVTLAYPANDTINQSVNQTFICNVSDWQLSNMTFRVWNATGIYYNETVEVSGVSNSTVINLTNMPYADYTWNCEAGDSLNNFGSFSSNYSLTVGGVSSLLSNPADENYTKFNLSNFNCRGISEDTYELANMTLYIWNGSGDLVHNESADFSGQNNFTEFSHNLTVEGNYTWNCRVVNAGLNSSFSKQNRTLFFDQTEPVISDLNATSITSSSATISWSTDELTNYSSSFDESSAEYLAGNSFSLTGLSASTIYSYNVTVCDKAENCVVEQDSFQTSAGSSGGNTGGSDEDDDSSSSGGAAPAATNRSQENITQGFSKSFSKNERKKIQLKGENHTIVVQNVSNSSVVLTIQSDPINVTLNLSEEKKINVTSTDHYDLFLKLNFIRYGKANLTIREIWEEMEVKSNLSSEEQNMTFETHESEESENEENKALIYFWMSMIFVAVLIILGALFLNREKVEEQKDKKGKSIKKKNGKTKE